VKEKKNAREGEEGAHRRNTEDQITGLSQGKGGKKSSEWKNQRGARQTQATKNEEETGGGGTGKKGGVYRLNQQTKGTEEEDLKRFLDQRDKTFTSEGTHHSGSLGGSNRKGGANQKTRERGVWAETRKTLRGPEHRQSKERKKATNAPKGVVTTNRRQRDQKKKELRWYRDPPGKKSRGGGDKRRKKEKKKKQKKNKKITPKPRRGGGGRLGGDALGIWVRLVKRCYRKTSAT